MLGTLITGCPRSGTTLALKVLCPDLTPEEALPSSTHNEPYTFWDWCYHWDDPARDVITEVRTKIPQLVARSRHHVIKSPHATPLLTLLDPDYRVIVTFRDIRLVVASMLDHKNTHKYGLCDDPYWKRMQREPKDITHMNVVQRALANAELYVRCGVEYCGSTEVWSYGFWDEWECNASDITNLYAKLDETPERVRDDVANNTIFSNKSFTIDTWHAACERHKISAADAAAVVDTNKQLTELYRTHGFSVKTLDDVG